MIMRLDRLIAEIPSFKSRSERGLSRSGAARREVRRDVDLHELHLPVLHFAPGPEPGEIEEIAQKLREAAGLPKEPTGEVAN